MACDPAIEEVTAESTFTIASYVKVNGVGLVEADVLSIDYEVEDRTTEDHEALTDLTEELVVADHVHDTPVTTDWTKNSTGYNVSTSCIAPPEDSVYQYSLTITLTNLDLIIIKKLVRGV